MNGFDIHQNTLRLEAIVASELSVLLEQHSVGSALNVEPSAGLLASLELYIPSLLSRYYPEWKNETLDGFFLETAQRIDSITAEFIGVCILMSDQTLTPIFISLTLSTLHNSIASYRVFLGELGSGHLGISRPREKVLMTTVARLKNIKWSYRIGNEL